MERPVGIRAPYIDMSAESGLAHLLVWLDGLLEQAVNAAELVYGADAAPASIRVYISAQLMPTDLWPGRPVAGTSMRVAVSTS